MTSADQVFTAHNASGRCACSTCNIVRLCDYMEALTIQSSRIIERYEIKEMSKA